MKWRAVRAVLIAWIFERRADSHGRPQRLFLAVAATLLLAIAASAEAQAVKTPEQFLGIRVGADRTLADMQQIAAYFRYLATASPRVKMLVDEPATMGNPFITVIVTSEANHRGLDRIPEVNQRLADPRGVSEDEANRLLADGKTVVMINCSIHSTEIAASQQSMELAYRLATENTPEVATVLDNVVLLLTPSHNPDGTQMVVDWYRRTLGTPYEGSSMPWLYHKYVGHDDNRDWYMLTQKETRITVARLHNVWHPQIAYDMHQMGETAARLFIPPYVDPADPNLDPAVTAATNALGSHMAALLTGEGKRGVVIHAMYDAWTPARGYANYHGGIRFLTEAASVKVATPITLRFDQLGRGIGYDAKVAAWNFPKPWLGGEWHLRDIMDYELSAAFALLNYAAAYRSYWLSNFFQVGKNAISNVDPLTGQKKPFAFIVRAGEHPVTAAKLMETLHDGAVEVHQARAPFAVDGVSYPAGTYVILMAQPYSAWAKTLLEVQHYPDIRQYPGGPPQRPYDVTAHTLPLLLGVPVAAASHPFQADLVKLETIAMPAGKIVAAAKRSARAKAYLIEPDVQAAIAVNRLLKAGLRVSWALRPFQAAGRDFQAGTRIVSVSNQRGVQDVVAKITAETGVDAYAVEAFPTVTSASLSAPRVAIYKSWVPSMDEGWTRWIFEQFEFPYTSVTDKDVRAGDLRARFDVIVLPQQSSRAIVMGHRPGSLPDDYVGGLGREGVTALRRFVEAGGTLVALDAASQFAIDELHVPVRNVLEAYSRRPEPDEAPAAAERTQGAQGPPAPGSTRDALGPSTADFYAPGSILRINVDSTHPVMFGLAGESIAWFEQSPAFEVEGAARALATYPDRDPLLSGWLLGGDKLRKRAAVVEAPLGAGHVIMFGFRPQYRAQTRSTYGMLFNALYYGTVKEARPATSSATNAK